MDSNYHPHVGELWAYTSHGMDVAVLITRVFTAHEMNMTNVMFMYTNYRPDREDHHSLAMLADLWKASREKFNWKKVSV